MKFTTTTRSQVVLTALFLGLFTPSVLFAGSQSFGANGTFTVPSGVTQIFVTGSGPGGCGYQASACSGGGGGGSGGHVENTALSVTSGASYPVTVGGYKQSTSLGALGSLTWGQDATGRSGAAGGSPGGVSGQSGSTDAGCSYNVGGGSGGSGGGNQVPGYNGSCTGPNAFNEMDCVDSDPGQSGGGGAGGGGVWLAGRAYTYGASCGGGGFLTIAWADPTVGTVNVSSNIAGASWTISGPTSITGSGSSASYASKPTGSYTITWGAVAGYTTPASQSFTLSSGSSISFSGTYTAPPAVNLFFSSLWLQVKDFSIEKVFALSQ